MLDSLVRVSRRVGWATDGRPLTLMPRHASRPGQTHAKSTARSPPDGRPVERGRDAAASRILGPPVGLPRRTVTPAAEATGHLSAGLMTTDKPVVAPARGKCTRYVAARRRRVREDLGRRRTPRDALNPTGHTRGPIRLPLNGFTYS